MVKNGRVFRDHGTLKSGVSHKWFDELSRLIEWFLCTDSHGRGPKTIIGSMSRRDEWNKLIFGVTIQIQESWKFCCVTRTNWWNELNFSMLIQI